MSQRVVLIADKAGMGETTVLTQLSKRIKQKYPAHWLVRNNLNDYTEQIMDKTVNKMDKVRVLELCNHVIRAFLDGLLEKSKP